MHIRTLGHNALVLQLLHKQARARVRVGGMELEVMLADLVAPLKKSGEKSSRPSKGDWKVDVAENEERELKLIGYAG